MMITVHVIHKTYFADVSLILEFWNLIPFEQIGAPYPNFIGCP